MEREAKKRSMNGNAWRNIIVKYPAKHMATGRVNAKLAKIFLCFAFLGLVFPQLFMR